MSVYKVLLLASLVMYRPPTYGTYKFPEYAIVIGWMITVIPLIPLPVMGFLAVKRTRGDSWKQVIRHLARNTNWGHSQSNISNILNNFL